MNLQKNLVGHWTGYAKDVSGTTARDRSGHRRHGSFEGNASQGGSSPKGGGFTFDGAGDRINTTDTLLNGFTAFTVCGWVNATTITSNAPAHNNSGNAIADKGGNSDDNFALYLGNSDEVYTYMDVGGTSSSYTNISVTTSSNPVSTGTWHHIASWYDGSNLKIFVDGVEEASTAAGGQPKGSTNVFGFGMSNTGNAPFDGTLADLRVYRRALTQAELDALVNMRADRRNKNPLGVAEKGHWTMDSRDTTSNVVRDRSGNRIAPALNGGPTTGTTAILGEGINFDGSSQYLETSSYSALPTGSEIFTVSCWFKLDTLPSNTTGSRADLWAWGNASTSNYNAVDVYDTSISWYNYSNDPSDDISHSFSTGKWYFYVTKWDGSTHTHALWDLNGQINKKSASLSGVNVTETGRLGIARDWERGTSYFGGTIADLRVWNRHLSSTEEQRLYEQRAPQEVKL